MRAGDRGMIRKLRAHVGSTVQEDLKKLIGTLNERKWTYNSVVKYPKGLNAPHVKNTITQVVVNADCFQIEFGITAGRPSRSCLPIQKMNAGMRRSAMVSSETFRGDLMEDAEPVMTLKWFSLSAIFWFRGKVIHDILRSWGAREGENGEKEKNTRQNIRQHAYTPCRDASTHPVNLPPQPLQLTPRLPFV